MRTRRRRSRGELQLTFLRDIWLELASSLFADSRLSGFGYLEGRRFDHPGEVYGGLPRLVSRRKAREEEENRARRARAHRFTLPPSRTGSSAQEMVPNSILVSTTDTTSFGPTLLADFRTLSLPQITTGELRPPLPISRLRAKLNVSPSPSSFLRWLHWQNHPITDGGKITFDMWPSTRELDPDELYEFVVFLQAALPQPLLPLTSLLCPLSLQRPRTHQPHHR